MAAYSAVRSLGSAWLRCSRETLDALAGFKRRHALPTWDATLTALLAEADRRAGDEPAAALDHNGETEAT